MDDNSLRLASETMLHVIDLKCTCFKRLF